MFLKKNAFSSKKEELKVCFIDKALKISLESNKQLLTINLSITYLLYSGGKFVIKNLYTLL